MGSTGANIINTPPIITTTRANDVIVFKPVCAASTAVVIVVMGRNAVTPRSSGVAVPDTALVTTDRDVVIVLVLRVDIISTGISMDISTDISTDVSTGISTDISMGTSTGITRAIIEDTTAKDITAKDTMVMEEDTMVVEEDIMVKVITV